MRRMKTWRWLPAALLLALGVTMAGRAEEFAIQSFDRMGRLTFNEIGGAVGYRVEWASTPGGPWTNSLAALASIASVGDGSIACSVPMCYRVIAFTSAPPPDMVLIPGGPFQMGDTMDDGGWGELPLHTNTLSAFYMDKYEVTWAKWQKVADWAITNGYTFGERADGKGANHPVHSVSWYDCLKWCNARSEMEGLDPAYYKDYSKTVVYRGGIDLDLPADFVRWDAGYRLPTEAEWEKAARGGVVGRRFPWGDTDTIDFFRANYLCSSYVAYDISGYDGWNPIWDDWSIPITSTAGAFAPNDYGLHDMAGNVFVWCWDWFDPNYYSVSPVINPRGPSSGLGRVLRGGSWGGIANSCRSSSRFDDSPGDRYYGIGFRACCAPQGQ